jgi:hypothetical protein
MVWLDILLKVEMLKEELLKVELLKEKLLKVELLKEVHVIGPA